MNKSSKAEFYRDKAVVSTDWYLCSCSFPDLAWARRRVFDDGTADSCFGENTKLFGFDHPDYANHILTEDEYVRFSDMDAEDEAEHGIRLSKIFPPSWKDDPNQDFEYLGTY